MGKKKKAHKEPQPCMASLASIREAAQLCINSLPTLRSDEGFFDMYGDKHALDPGPCSVPSGTETFDLASSDDDSSYKKQQDDCTTALPTATQERVACWDDCDPDDVDFTGFSFAPGSTQTHLVPDAAAEDTHDTGHVCNSSQDLGTQCGPTHLGGSVAASTSASAGPLLASSLQPASSAPMVESLGKSSDEALEPSADALVCDDGSGKSSDEALVTLADAPVCGVGFDSTFQRQNILQGEGTSPCDPELSCPVQERERSELPAADESELCALDNSDTLSYDYTLGPQSDIRGSSVSGSVSMHVDFQTHARATLPDVFPASDDDGDDCDGSLSDVGRDEEEACDEPHALDFVGMQTSRTQCGPLPQQHMQQSPCAQAPPSHAQHAPHAPEMQTWRTQCGPLPQQHMKLTPCAQAPPSHAQQAPHAPEMQTWRTQCGPLPQQHMQRSPCALAQAQQAPPVQTSRTQCGPLPQQHLQPSPCAQAQAQQAPPMQTSRTQCGPLPQQHMKVTPCAQAPPSHAQQSPHAPEMQTWRTQCGPLPHAHADFHPQVAGPPTPQADEEDYVCPFGLFDDELLASAGGGDPPHVQHAPHALGHLGVPTSRTQCEPLPLEHVQQAPCAQEQLAQQAPQATVAQSLFGPTVSEAFKDYFSCAVSPSSSIAERMARLLAYDASIQAASALLDLHDEQTSRTQCGHLAQEHMQQSPCVQALAQQAPPTPSLQSTRTQCGPLPQQHVDPNTQFGPSPRQAATEPGCDFRNPKSHKHGRGKGKGKSKGKDKTGIADST